MTKKIRIGALVSGGGSNLQAIIDACEAGKIDAEVVFVGADNPDAKGLQRAANHKIPAFYVDYKPIIQAYKKNPTDITLPDDFDFETVRSKLSLFSEDADPKRVNTFIMTRVAAEFQLLKKMRAYPFDLLVLAGFMRTLTPYFIDKINTDPEKPCIMNIHPALLPSFPGLDGYGDTFKYGCKVGGGTVHFVDYGEDSGPIIGQKAFPIEPDDTLDSIKSKGLALEWQLYPECIQLFAEKRLKVEKTSYIQGNGEKIEKSVVKILPA